MGGLKNGRRSVPRFKVQFRVPDSNGVCEWRSLWTNTHFSVTYSYIKALKVVRLAWKSVLSDKFVA